MIIEHEILEQLLIDDWPLSRTVAFLAESGADAWLIIARHTQERNLRLLDSTGNALPDWKVQEILRLKNPDVEAMVHCTDKGARIVA